MQWRQKLLLFLFAARRQKPNFAPLQRIISEADSTCGTNAVKLEPAHAVAQLGRQVERCLRHLLTRCEVKCRRGEDLFNPIGIGTERCDSYLARAAGGATDGGHNNRAVLKARRLQSKGGARVFDDAQRAFRLER